MLEYLFLIFIAFVAIIVASIEDIKKREVANWINYSLLIIALVYRAFYSVLTWDYMPIVYGLLGVGVMVAIGNLLYYGRVFAGGDAKLLIGLGAVLPLSSNLYENSIIFLSFILLLLFLGSFYGIVYSLVLAVKHRRIFSKEFVKQFKKNKLSFIYAVLIALALVIFAFFSNERAYFVFPLLALLFPIMFVYGKSIEESCMIVKTKTVNLTLGDWLYEEVRVGGKLIKPNWEGINEEELKLLKKSNKEVSVKNGIPFVPAFLFAFLTLVIFYKDILAIFL